MLIIFGGVQASGKTTIQNAVKEAYPESIALQRSDALKEALIESPRDIGTTNHLTVLYRILNCWDDILQTAMEDSDKNIYTLDAGPITTIAYNCLTLYTAVSSPNAWEHYVKVRTETETPYTKLLTQAEVSELARECAETCTQYLTNSFTDHVLQKHKSVMGIYFHTHADIIAKRFKERRDDIRVNNMQNWFIDKQAEIDNYSRAYAFASEALNSVDGQNRMVFDTVSTSGSIEDTVAKTLEAIRRQR